MTSRRGTVWAAQAALAIILAVFVGRAVWANWTQFKELRLDLAFSFGPIALAGLVTVGTYALLIEAWRRVVGSWGDRLTYLEAGYIWTVSNLGRYIPGKIWTVAGLVALARRAGISGANATVSGLIMQVLAVGTGAALGEHVLEIQDIVMEKLGLRAEEASLQIIGRDRYIEFISIIANIATSSILPLSDIDYFDERRLLELYANV